MTKTWWLWAGIAATIGYFIARGKPAVAQPETVSTLPADRQWEWSEGYDESVARDPEYRVDPEPWQLFGTDAFFIEAKRRRAYDMSGYITKTIDPIYATSASSGELRLVGDLLPNGEYFPKGASEPLDLPSLDPVWAWR